jgi:hypothetical protein
VLQRIAGFITYRSEEIAVLFFSLIGLILGLMFYGTIGFLIFHYWTFIVHFVVTIPYFNDYPCPGRTGSLNVLVADLARR